MRLLLREHRPTQSMSALANPCHKTWTASLMGTLKAEIFQGGALIDAHDARTEILACIDGCCNIRRKHSTLACPPPPIRIKHPSK